MKVCLLGGMISFRGPSNIRVLLQLWRNSWGGISSTMGLFLDSILIPYPRVHSTLQLSQQCITNKVDSLTGLNYMVGQSRLQTRPPFNTNLLKESHPVQLLHMDHVSRLDTTVHLLKLRPSLLHYLVGALMFMAHSCQFRVFCVHKGYNPAYLNLWELMLFLKVLHV
nr:hypothetical protein Iba_scaffold954250CG0010 [Ipomoea batatas]GME09257.1 hypothetical protein Iba_scaffold8486CG0050 [Ipomoea batatas]